MIKIDEDPEERLASFARWWLELLARGEWEQAIAAIDEPNMYGMRWTKERILQQVLNTFGPGTRFHGEFGSPVFSEPSAAIGKPHACLREVDGGGYWFDYDIPLNGAYSDLTAQFQFLPRLGGFAVVLHDLHVL